MHARCEARAGLRRLLRAVRARAWPMGTTAVLGDLHSGTFDCAVLCVASLLFIVVIVVAGAAGRADGL